jgi:hypothetical protein
MAAAAAARKRTETGESEVDAEVADGTPAGA